MRKERKHFTPEENVAILRRHLLDKAPVSELCEELALRPTVRLIQTYVDHYNAVRLHGAIGYVTPPISSPDARPRFMRPAIASSSRRVTNGSFGGQPSQLHILRT